MNVQTSRTYTLDVRFASIGTGASFHAEVDGRDVTGSMSVPDTGGWQVWRTISKTGITLTAGTRVVCLVLDKGTSQNTAVGTYNFLAWR